ncbi:MAG TPA: LuxR C-terminal-related transcriptional regulator [Anaerolineales bacterium]|jgi:DNA-binding CsgD family transcriptional regulator
MRLQFEMTRERIQELDDLVNRLGLKTRANLLNEALTLYEWAIRELESGRIIASLDEEKDQYKEIEMPGFLAVKSGAQEMDQENFLEALSDKEKEILDLLYQGRADQEIAAVMGVSPRTAKLHIRNVINKLISRNQEQYQKIKASGKI